MRFLEESNKMNIREKEKYAKLLEMKEMTNFGEKTDEFSNNNI